MCVCVYVCMYENSTTNTYTITYHAFEPSTYNNYEFVSFVIAGKSGNSKDICGDDKFKEDGDPWNVEAQAAFLGPNLWDKTLPYDTDLKVTHVSILSLPNCFGKQIERRQRAHVSNTY